MSEEPFGVCPECGSGPVITSIYRDHFAFCDEDRLVWPVGSNLFSAWREQTVEEWREAYEHIKWYEMVTHINGRTGLPVNELLIFEKMVPSTEPPEIPF